MNKKIIGAILTVLVFAGAAAAAQGNGNGSGNGCSCGNPPGGGRPQLTRQEQAQRDEMRKIHQDIKAELDKANPNKARARQLFAKQLDMREKFMTERFNNRLASGNKDGRDKMGGPGEMKGPGKHKPDSKAWKDLRAEMSKPSPDKAKANALFKEVLREGRKRETARFEEVLKDPSKFKQMDERREGGKKFRGNGPACGPECGRPDCGKPDCPPAPPSNN